MKKLKLDVESIEVLSLPTTSESEVLRGTVEGRGTSLFACTVTDTSRRGTSVCCETRFD